MGAILLGLIMATAPMVALMGSDTAPADDPPDEGPGDDPGAGADAGNAAVSDDLQPATIAEDYRLELAPGVHVFADFVPEEDILTLSTGNWDLVVTSSADEAGATLRIERDEGATLLHFPGLPEVPLDDIVLEVAEPGGAPIAIFLADLIDQSEVLAPADPDAPDVPPSDPLAGPALAPTDPDAPDLPPNDPLLGPALAPTDPDAPDP